ncbi:MAG: putative DNA-3-methyladenine glycosylase [Candidatus Saccharibacteria bacterium]|nr:putative DNA-3-methyladenine glycosylase [Candidatus Saccharibacteria bacterium]
MEARRLLFNYNYLMTSWEQRLHTAQAHLAASDPILERLIQTYGDCRIAPHADYYGELVSSIIGQQLSEKAGATIYRRFLGLFDGNVPTPEQLLSTDTDEIRAIGCSYRKVSYMKDLAIHILDERLDLVHIATLPNDSVTKQLISVKGIGEWTAHMFMIFSLGRLDILPTGDLGVRKAMMNLYRLPDRPSPSQMLAVSLEHNWAPYQSIASWYMWRSLENSEERIPRKA